MGARVLRGLGWAALAAGLVACAALSGASDLTVCENCGENPTPEQDGSSDDGAFAADAGADTTVLPPTCNPGDIACDGNLLATCSNNAWVRTPCAQACNAAQCAPWPSCRSMGDAGCGAGSATSCCEGAAVPGGTFNRHDNAAWAATVSPFKLDIYEVTVGRFRAFLAAGKGTQASPPAAGSGAHPKIPGSGWQTTWNPHLPADMAAVVALLDDSGATWTTSPGANERKPIINVTWPLAFAFCAWDGGRLPTRAEFNFAAAGGNEQRRFPWVGTAITANNQANYNCAFDSPSFTDPPSSCSVGGASPCVTATCADAGGTCNDPPPFGCEGAIDIAPVGNYASGMGRWGHFELAGNVKEYVLDRWMGPEGNPPAGACIDCALLVPADPAPSGNKVDVVLLGGDFNDTGSAALRNSSWIELAFDFTSAFSGFRCARD